MKLVYPEGSALKNSEDIILLHTQYRVLVLDICKKCHRIFSIRYKDKRKYKLYYGNHIFVIDSLDWAVCEHETIDLVSIEFQYKRRKNGKNM